MHVNINRKTTLKKFKIILTGSGKNTAAATVSTLVVVVINKDDSMHTVSHAPALVAAAGTAVTMCFHNNSQNLFATELFDHNSCIGWSQSIPCFNRFISML